MQISARDKLIERAREVLKNNDLGSYTVPTHGLYPFQWNWDSCLSALGLGRIDEDRAWTEIETLMAHQWDDGMVPHIIFHKEDDGYFPGPEVWGTNREVPTSGISNPPLAGFAARHLYEGSDNKPALRARLEKLIPAISHWHDWFYRCRDPENTGLVAVIHPWETGRDNSVDWDGPFEKVPTDGIGAYRRRDTDHANPEHRPTKAQYDRYIWLVTRFRELGWDNSRLHDASPFRVVDPGFNAILSRSCEDLAALADQFGMHELAEHNRALSARTATALSDLWSDHHGQFLCLDRCSGELIQSPSIGGLLPVFANIDSDYGKRIASRIRDLGKRTRFLVPSHDPSAQGFDPGRYWRGPIWLIVNFMIIDGLERIGETDTMEGIIDASLDLINHGGMAEYYNPLTGEACGGDSFTWTAAMVLEILHRFESDAEKGQSV